MTEQGATSVETTAPSRDQRWPFAIGAVAVSGLFSWNVSRFWFIGDDAFITFRYAKHLAEGHGLVWNIGERVEGYTNFLWAVFLALGIKLGAPPEAFSLWLGVLCGAAVLVAVTAAQWRWTPGAFALFPAAVLASNRSFAAWCSGGLETQLFTLLLCLGSLLFARRLEGGRGTAGAALCLGLLSLTRPEGVLFAGVVGAFALFGALRSRFSWRELATAAALYLGLVIPHLLWRHSYYGFWLPNTFYAKVNGFWPEQGAKYLSLLATDYDLAWLGPLAVIGAFWRASAASLLLLALVVTCAVYLLSIGGDVFDFRFVVPVMPAFALLLARALVQLHRNPRPAVRFLVVASAFAIVTVAALRHGRSIDVADRSSVESISHTKAYGAARIAEGKRLQKLVETGIIPSSIRYGTGAAGATPYYSGLYTLDFLGLNDVGIAHQPLSERGRIGHEKQGTYAYMRERRIAMIDTLQGVVFATPPRGTVQGNPPRFCRYPFKCARFAEGYLIFETGVPDAELRSLLGHLEFLPYPNGRPGLAR